MIEQFGTTGRLVNICFSDGVHFNFWSYVDKPNMRYELKSVDENLSNITTYPKKQFVVRDFATFVNDGRQLI